MRLRLAITTLIIIYFNSILIAYTIDKGSELLNAVDQKDIIKVKKLIKAGANVNKKGKVGFTPLLLASGWGDVEMVSYLIDNGARLDSRANPGFGVIHRASMNKNPSVLKYLLENFKFNVNDRANEYCSPLDYSLRNNALQNNGTLKNAKLLIQHGAKKSINWKCRGYTPLMVAIPDFKVITFLLNNNADKHIKNPIGHTAYNMAENQKAPDHILKLIKTNKFTNKKTFVTKRLIWELKTFENKYDKYSQHNAIEYCEKLKLEGNNNWRIPSASEYSDVLSVKPYKGLVIDGIPQYYMNPQNFTNMTPDSYWTILNNGVMGYQSTSWNQVHKKRGNIKYHIRCVHTKI